jgi:hypothetical protein
MILHILYLPNYFYDKLGIVNSIKKTQILIFILNDLVLLFMKFLNLTNNEKILIIGINLILTSFEFY